MKKGIIFILCAFMLLSTICDAQIAGKETLVDDDGLKNTITNSYTGMYDGTTNKKAKEFFAKADNYGRVNDYKNAKKYYLKAIKEDPTFVEAYDNVGRIFRGEGDLEKAISYYKKSIELYPQGVMAHQNLAVVYGIQKNHEGAIKEYETIVKLEPENAEGYFGLANTQMVASDFEPAMENAKKALKIYEATDSYHLADGYYMCGMISYYLDRRDDARVYLLLAESNGANIDPRFVKELELRKQAVPESTEETPTEDKKDLSESLKLKTEEDYKTTEPLVVKFGAWLEQKPLGEEKQLRKEISAFVVKWMTGVSYLSVELSEETIPYMKCFDCLTVFLGNYAKHAIESNNYEDEYGSTLAATESVIRFYIANKSSLGKNKEIEKLIKLQDKNELSTFIKGK